MKKWKLLVAFMLLLTLFSLSPAHAPALAQQNDNDEELHQLVKEKRESIQELQLKNEKLEKQIEEKSEKLDQLMMYLPENRVVSLEHVEKQLNAKLETFMDQVMKIDEVEKSIWKHLNKGNKQIAANNMQNGIKQLDKAIEGLETKNRMLVEFIATIEDLIAFVESLELK